jgi:hypothetical protein
MKKILFAVACIAAVTLSGCASILNEKTQPINVSSSTGGAISGTIDGVEFTGPGVVNVARENKDKVLMTTTDGCVKETALPKSVDTKFFINIISGGVFGSTTDYSTEKMWRYSETVVVACK